MTQDEAVASWWREADEPTRRRVLRLAPDDLLPEDMQRGLAMAGVTVVPLGRSGVDGGPLGYLQPDVLVEFLQQLRTPAGERWRCSVCGEVYLDRPPETMPSGALICWSCVLGEAGLAQE